MSNQQQFASINDRGIVCFEEYGISPSSMYDKMDEQMMAMMRSMSDDEMKSSRDKMVSERMKKRTELEALGDKKYTSAEGSQLFSDIAYYDRCISKMECEMACRMMTL